MSDEVCELPQIRPDSQKIDRILHRYRRIAVVGLSRNPEKDSFQVARYLMDHGYEVLPVNPNAEELLGRTSYSSLKALPETPEVVCIFRKPSDVGPVVEEAIEAGAKVVWMQKRIVNNEAGRRALEAGLEVVMDRCMMVEHRRMSEATS